MFRKIVTELAYSPALAGNLGRYIKQLRIERSRRQIGLIFLVLAMVMQIFATVFPPESANANNPSTFIDGGVQSINDYLAHYDQNTGNSKSLLLSLGVSRDEIAAAKLVEYTPPTTSYIWSMYNNREENSNEYFFTTNTTQAVAYYHLSSSSRSFPAFVGTSAQIGVFAIQRATASLLTEKRPLSFCDTWLASPNQPLRITSFSGYSNDGCADKIDTSLTAREISSTAEGIEKLHPSNRIAYTLTMKNTSDKDIAVIPSVNLEDALEYSRVLDYGGGDYNYDTTNLTWPTVTIAPNTSVERTVIIQLLPVIPATAEGKYITRSYDCTITVSFGTTLSNPVSCPPTKYVELFTHTLPDYSVKHSLLLSFVFLATVIFLYLRARQLLHELYIIRHNHLGGL